MREYTKDRLVGWGLLSLVVLITVGVLVSGCPWFLAPFFGFLGTLLIAFVVSLCIEEAKIVAVLGGLFLGSFLMRELLHALGIV